VSVHDDPLELGAGEETIPLPDPEPVVEDDSDVV
jgi:hypothetical protein